MADSAGTQDARRPSCLICRVSSGDVRPMNDDQKQFLAGLGSAVEVADCVRGLGSAFWCTLCRKVGIEAMRQGGSPVKSRASNSGFKKKRKRLHTPEAIIEAFREVKRRRFAQRSGADDDGKPSNACTLCEEVQVRYGAGTVVKSNYAAEPANGAGDIEVARKHVSHSTVAGLFEKQDMAEVSGLFFENRERAGECLPKRSVHDVLTGASPERKVCQLHYQAFYRALKYIDSEKCPLCLRRVSRSESTPLKTLVIDMDDVERVVLVETALLLVTGLEGSQRWQSEALQRSNSKGTNIGTVGDSPEPESSVGDVDVEPHDAVDAMLQKDRSCLRCYKFLQRKARLDIDRHYDQRQAEAILDFDVVEIGQEAHSFGDDIMRDICKAEEARLNAEVGSVGHACILYQKYLKAHETNAGPGLSGACAERRCMRTMMRCIVRHTEIIVFGCSAAFKGSMLLSKGTVQSFVHSGAYSAFAIEEGNFWAIRKSLLEVAAVYKDPETKRKFKAGEWSMVQEIKRFNPVLWKFQWRLVESSRERVQRVAAERLDADGVAPLSWPFTDGGSARDEDFRTLSMPMHRKVMRVFALLQKMVYVRDKDAVGPVTWGISTCALLQGNKPLMTLLNRLVYTISYSTMNRERCAAAKKEGAKPHIDKVLRHLLLKFAWDNLDARLVANTVRLVGKTLDWHGTVLIAYQMPTAPPIVTSERFRSIDTAQFPTAEALVRHSVTGQKTVRFFNIMTAALVLVFQNNLLAIESDQQVFLDYLLRRSIRGSACGKPANIANLIMLDRPSNDADTARQLMDEACMITAQQSAAAGDPSNALRYCLMTADNPLYAQMQRIMRDCPEGARNASYERVLPFAGHMHQSMAFQDALKYCCWDFCLDALAASSGLSKGMVLNFRNRKEYKTCLRLSRQCPVAMWIRVFDVLFEEGLLLASDGDLQKFHVTACSAGASRSPLTDLFNCVTSAAVEHGPVSADFEEHLNCDSVFFGSLLERLGTKIVDTVNAKASELGDPNFTFFTTDVMQSFLSPSLGMYYISRAGQLRGRQQVIRHFMPYIFTTRKTAYQIASVWQLEFDCVAPKAILEVVYGPGGSSTNITGRSAFGSVEEDEALEMTGVRATKEGAASGTLESLRTSFFSSATLLKAKDKMYKECRALAEHEERDEEIRAGSGGAEDDGERRVPRDRYKTEAMNVLGMYNIANGNKSQSGFAFLGMKHRQSPMLVNILVEPPLVLSPAETDRMLNRHEHGIRAAADLFARVVHPYRKPGDSQKGTRKHAIAGFAGARDLELKRRAKSGRDKSRKGRVQLVKTATQAIGRQLLQYAEILSNASAPVQERELAAAASERLRRTIDLVSPLNLAMRENDGDELRHGTKSAFFRELCAQLCQSGNGGLERDTSSPKFILEGYPPLPTAHSASGRPFHRLMVAVDISNYVHHPVHTAFSLTVGMHAEQLARFATDSLLRLARQRGLVHLELHIDDPELVPFQKCEV